MGKKTKSGSGKKKKRSKEEKDEETPPVKRKGPKKGLIITAVLVLILIIVVVLIALWGFSGDEGYLTTSNVMKSKEDYLNKTIEVKGTVVRDSLNTEAKTFNISDGDVTINIQYEGMLPSGFKEDTDVVIKGILMDENGALFVAAEEITLGCPSKY